MSKIIIKIEFETANLALAKMFSQLMMFIQLSIGYCPDFLQATHFCHIPKAESIVFPETNSFIPLLSKHLLNV